VASQEAPPQLPSTSRAAAPIPGGGGLATLPFPFFSPTLFAYPKPASDSPTPPWHPDELFSEKNKSSPSTPHSVVL